MFKILRLRIFINQKQIERTMVEELEPFEECNITGSAVGIESLPKATNWVLPMVASKNSFGLDDSDIVSLPGQDTTNEPLPSKIVKAASFRIEGSEEKKGEMIDL